jgi:hypothetical protein
MASRCIAEVFSVFPPIACCHALAALVRGTSLVMLGSIRRPEKAKLSVCLWRWRSRPIVRYQLR